METLGLKEERDKDETRSSVSYTLIDVKTSWQSN